MTKIIKRAGSRNGEKERVKRRGLIANQMMKGQTMGRLPADQNVIDQFRERYKDVIEWVDAKLSTRASVGMLGAIGKAVLWYGKERMLPFCEALTHGRFSGYGDPAHILYLYCNTQSRLNTKNVYRKTVSAIRYFIAERKITRIRDGQQIQGTLHASLTDLFDWDSTFTKMIMRHNNQRTDNKKTQIREALA